MHPKDLLLAPLSALYKVGAFVYHTLYDDHVLPSVRVSVPTICVGNLAVGGTGKTPHVEYLLRMLLRNGLRPAVLSRGYKRATHGFVLADHNSTAETIGDEPMQIYRHFPNVPVAVCENRVRGIRQIQRQIMDVDVVVLDDAFQHRRLRPGFSILLTEHDRLYVHDHMLPLGRLRDLPYRANQANIIVVTKCPEHLQPIDKRVLHNALHVASYQNLYFTTIKHPAMKMEGSPLVVAGIANPEFLRRDVLKYYPNAAFMFYPDHHYFQPDEVKDIQQQLKHHDFVLTTEKDLPRLELTALVSAGKPLVALPIETVFLGDEENYEREVLTYVREQLRKQPAMQ